MSLLFYVAFYWVSYESLKKKFGEQQPSFWFSFVAGATSGTVSFLLDFIFNKNSLFTYLFFFSPFTVNKICLQTNDLVSMHKHHMTLVTVLHATRNVHIPFLFLSLDQCSFHKARYISANFYATSLKFMLLSNSLQFYA